jgi:hypothetical protein
LIRRCALPISPDILFELQSQQRAANCPCDQTAQEIPKVKAHAFPPMGCRHKETGSPRRPPMICRLTKVLSRSAGRCQLNLSVMDKGALGCAIIALDRATQMFHVCSHGSRDARRGAEPWLEGAAHALRQRLSAGITVYEALRLSQATQGKPEAATTDFLIVILTGEESIWLPRPFCLVLKRFRLYL